MNQDEIIEMAVNSGAIPIHKHPKNKALVGNENIEAFAKMVEARAFNNAYEKGLAGFMQATKVEREACAEICENFADVASYPDGIIQDYHAHLIRLRGKA